MSTTSFYELIQGIHSPFSLDELFCLMTQTPYQCVFLKDECSRYLYANSNFIQLMGLKNIQQLRQSTDQELSTSPEEAKKYRELDCCILEEGHTLAVKETIAPKKNQPIIKTMQGTLYHLSSKNNKYKGFVLGVVAPESQLLKLDWDTVFQLTTSELRDLLVKRSFALTLPWGDISLSKMEILTLIQLFKGQHAGEIANALCIKQTTVESYLVNIKNKLGVSHKSELIHVITKHHILQQIVI